MLEIIPMKYDITDKKYDSTNFENIRLINFDKEKDKFIDSNTNEEIEFDLESFVSYYTDYQISEAELMKGNLKYYSNREVMKGVCRHILSNIIPGYHYLTHFILDDSNNIKGFIRMKTFKNKSENMLSISELYIVPRYRKQGLATSLLNYAKMIAIQNNTESLQLAAQKGNFVAISLYKKFGFKVIKSKPHQIIGSQDQLFLYQMQQ